MTMRQADPSCLVSCSHDGSAMVPWGGIFLDVSTRNWASQDDCKMEGV